MSRLLSIMGGGLRVFVGAWEILITLWPRFVRFNMPASSQKASSSAPPASRPGWLHLAWPWAAAVVSGLMMAGCFAPFDQTWLAWIALMPLTSALWFSKPWARREPLRKFLLGYLTGCAFFLTTFYWIHHVAVAAYLSLPFYLALYPGLWGLFMHYVGTPRQKPGVERSIWLSSASNLRIALVAAAGWTATEWLRGTVFSGFGWNGLGVSLHTNLPMLQLTDLIGVGGLSFLIVLANVIVVATVQRLRLEVGRQSIRPHYDFSLALALIAIGFTYGFRQAVRYQQEEGPLSEQIPLRISAVQANIPIDIHRTRTAESVRYILDRYARQTEVAIALDPDLLIWPEAALPYSVTSNEGMFNFTRQVTDGFKGDHLMGTVHFEPEVGDYNSAFLLSREGQKGAIYHKMHLVPFGEFIPFRDSFPIFVWIMGHLVPGDFDAGQFHAVLEMSNGVKIGPLICFEDTLGDLARHFALEGAQLFVNVTNDGWFYESAASRQHLANAVFRCAENKLPMVRSANTGVTAIVDRLGRVTEFLADENGNTFIEGVLSGTVEVPVNPQPTFYARYGELFSIACLAVSGFALALHAAGRGRRQKQG